MTPPISPILPRSSVTATSSPRKPGPARFQVTCTCMLIVNSSIGLESLESTFLLLCHCQVPISLDVSRISSSIRSALAPLTKLSNSSTNTSSSSSPFCRICHDLSRSESLISPCRCSGSCGLIHKTCLERWLSTSASTNPRDYVLHLGRSFQWLAPRIVVHPLSFIQG